MRKLTTKDYAYLVGTFILGMFYILGGWNLVVPAKAGSSSFDGYYYQVDEPMQDECCLPSRKDTGPVYTGKDESRYPDTRYNTYSRPEPTSRLSKPIDFLSSEGVPMYTQWKIKEMCSGLASHRQYGKMEFWDYGFNLHSCQFGNNRYRVDVQPFGYAEYMRAVCVQVNVSRSCYKWRKYR